jgi:acetyl esterase
MAAVLTLMVKDHGGPQIRLRVLFYPATDTNFETESYRDFDHGRFLARAFMRFGWDIYAPDAEIRKEPYAAPLQASIEQLNGLPPALVQTAENDPLRDEKVKPTRTSWMKPGWGSSRPATSGKSMILVC